MERNVYIENTPLEEARRIFTDHLEQCGYFTIDSEEVNVLDSQGRITSSPVIARRSSPHYIASAMDGIAVKAESTYTANELNPLCLEKKDFVEVDTGDYVSKDFDAVIMIEDVNYIDNSLQIIKPAVPWQHIRSVGEDLVAQDMIVTCATKIGPYEIASFLTAAVENVAVVKKPIIAIIPTGTELCDKGSENMQPGEIVESNSRMLSALCLDWGAEPIRYATVKDDKELLRQAINNVKDSADMLIICSGSSAGKEDYTASIINELGQLLVHGIATRPGKPTVLGIIDNKPVIGIPGYPVSAQLVFTLFAKPVLYRKQGIRMPKPEKLECSISRKIPSAMGVDEFVYANTAKIKNQYRAYPLNRGAGISTSLVKADGVIHIKRGNEGLNTGEKCQLFLKTPHYVVDETLVCIGSHDMSIDILADILQRDYTKRLISTNVGSMGGIIALSRGETHFAGIHLLDDNGEYNMSYLKKYLPNKKWMLINLVKRQQGLMIKKGNPLKITCLDDLLRPEVRYINRQKGAGTRVLLDYLLDKKGIKASAVNGYNREEYTHLAIAASIKNDACDTGLGIYASAKAMNLDFIPVAEEEYDLCILPELMLPEALDILMKTIKNDDFRNRTEKLGGYNLSTCGKLRNSC